MPSLNTLLTDIDARYRNTFSNDQKVIWMNQVQRNIYQMVRKEATPYNFTTINSQAFYPLPVDCDIKSIENVTIETNVGSNVFVSLDYMRKEEEAGTQFYSLVERNLFLYPVPDATTAGKNVYLYYAKKPLELNSSNLSVIPDLDENFHELLILGTLSRIAAARKDAVMKNNYDSDYQLLLDDYQFMDKMSDPEFLSPIDVIPKIRRSW